MRKVTLPCYNIVWFQLSTFSYLLQPEDGVKEQQVLARLVDLNARKAHVKGMISLLSSLKDKEGGEAAHSVPCCEPVAGP